MAFTDRALAQLTITRFKGFFREPSALFWTFGFPIVLSVALGLAFRSRPPEPVYAVVEEGPGAEQLLAALRASPDVKAELVDTATATRALRTGKAAIVVVPATAGRVRGYRFDPTRPESRLARSVVDDALQRADGRKDPTPVADQKVSDKGARYIDFLVPGLLGMSLMSSGLWGIGFLLVEWRTRKLIKRLVATPMRRLDFLLSFVFMRMVFLIIEVPFLLGFTRLTFGVTMQGSYLLFCTLTVVGGLMFSGLGLLVASRAQNTQTVGGLINLIMMPMFMCSGVFFSTAHFPEAMQPVIRALPLTALNDSLRAVMNEGAGLSAVMTPLVVMLLWGVVSVGVALRLFRWS